RLWLLVLASTRTRSPYTTLFRSYVEEGANDAFSELVQRHVNFVYSAALRQLNGDAHLAADATQVVFTDLARKAPALAKHRVLAGDRKSTRLDSSPTVFRLLL